MRTVRAQISLATFHVIKPSQRAGTFLEISTGVQTRAGSLLTQTSLYMWGKTLQSASLFVVLNILSVCYEFPNLAMKAILEWTPGQAWRQSEDRAALKKTSNSFGKRMNRDRIFSEWLVEAKYIRTWTPFGRAHFYKPVVVCKVIYC